MQYDVFFGSELLRGSSTIHSHISAYYKELRMSEINADQMEPSSDQQRILITGVSGLIGRILFNYLTKTYPQKYQVFGLDQHMKISSRYQSTTHDPHQVQTMFPLSSETFFQCNITDRTKLHHIVEEQKIDIIIHLAAVLETDPDLEKISRVNIQGTKNVFEAPGVRRIIYASSTMALFGYLTREPYRSIVNGTFDDATMLKDLEKLSVAKHLPLPDLETPGNKVYCESKIIYEQMAADIVKNTSKSIICVRFGWVNVDDYPGPVWYRSTWLSHRDLCSFIDKVLEAPLNISGTYFAMSNNHWRWVDLDDAKRDLGYVPQDGAEKL